jgi:glycosyltransferase involved in cell wall biosynthesis
MSATGGIAVVTSGFPRRSETFALNELLALEQQGALAAVFATKPGDGSVPQPGAERLAGRVRLLPAVSPARQAEAVVEGLEGKAVTAVHGYFAHQPAEVAIRAAEKLRVPCGFSVHARDARKLSRAELGARARAAACVVACNEDVAGQVREAGGEPLLAPHGVDLRRFASRPSGRGRPFSFLAVGRLVPKKGFDVLIQAASRIEDGVRIRIVGEGPERDRLAAAIAAVDVSRKVELVGPRTHAELPDEYARADAVVVPSITDAGGDRDGLPNVVLEAMASARPVVGSRIGAIPSAVKHGETGLLVPEGDALGLAEALATLVRDPALRRRLGRTARARVERDYDLVRCTERLRRLLEGAYA